MMVEPVPVPFTLLLAQDGAAPLPFDATAAPAETTTTGGTAVPRKAVGGITGQPMLIMAGFLILMIVVMSMGSRRDKKKRQAMLSAVKKHDKVQTVGGVIGSIVELKPEFVVLKVDESANTRITFARSAIQQVLSSGDEKPAAVQAPS